MVTRGQMARPITGAHYGLSSWLVQRMSAVVMALYTVIVLAVLGLASAAIVSSVWQDLGDERSNLRKMVRRIADGDLDIDSSTTGGVDRSLRGTVIEMTHRLRDTISLIRQATDSISTASTM